MTLQERIQKFTEKLSSYILTKEQKRNLIDQFIDSERIHKKLRETGYGDRLDFPHTTAYINSQKPLDDYFISIVLQSLSELKYKEIAIPFLREAKSKYDGKFLIPVFYESDKQGKWNICDAIVHNPPLNINDWVKATYLSKEYGYSETGLLPLAIAKMFPRDEAREILKQGFDHHYRVTPEALGKVGTIEDIPFLEQKLLLGYDATHVHKDIKKAIQKIKKRTKMI